MAGKFKQIIEVIFKGAGKAASDSKKVQKGLQGVAKDAAKIAAAFYAAKGGINATKNFVSNALAVEQLTPAFESLRKELGFSANTLDNLNKAVDGTVKQVDLMKIANQAMTLGVVDSEEGFAELFNTAQRLGKSLGVDTVSAIDSLVTGMGRQSIMMLDNLGIIVDTQKANEDYAESVGKTVSELTDQERKIAFNNAALESAQEKVKVLGDENLTAADSFAQLAKASDDLGAGMGAFVMPVLDGAASMAAGLIEQINELLGFTEEEAEKVDTGEADALKTRMLIIKAMPESDLKRAKMQQFVNKELGLERENIDANHLSLSEFSRLTDLVSKSRIVALQAESDARRKAGKVEKEVNEGSILGFRNSMEVAQDKLDALLGGSDWMIADEVQKADAVLLGFINNTVLATQEAEKNKEEISDLAVKYGIQLSGGLGETATAYQQWVDDLQASEDTRKQQLDWIQQLTEDNYELAKASGLVNDAGLDYNQTQLANLEAQREQQELIDDFVALYPEEAEALGILSTEQKQINKEYEESIERKKELKKQTDAEKDSRDALVATMRKQVDAAMALGAAQTHAGQAAGDAAGVYIVAEIQKALATRLATAFADTGFWGGMAAVATSALVGNLMAQTIQSISGAKFAAEGMNEVVTEPTLIVAGEEGAEYVNIEPTQNEGAGMGGGSQIVFQGNVLSDRFIEEEAIPKIRDAIRRGHNIA